MKRVFSSLPANSPPQSFQDLVREHQSGDLDTAEQGYRAYLEREPNFAPCLHMLGVVSLQRKDFLAALDWIGRAIAIDSEQAVYFNNYGAALHRLDRRIEALAAFHRAAEIRPKYVDALSNLGMIYDELGQYVKAATIFRKALELAPENTEVKQRFGKVTERRGETAELMRLCEHLLQHQPSAELHVRMGNHLVGKGMALEAENQYQQALELEPENVLAIFNMANALQEQHKIPEARDNFRRAAKLRPKHAFWRLRVAATCPVLWDSSAAIDEYCGDLSQELDRWIEAPPPAKAQELVNAGAFPGFSFAYLGRNVMELKRKFATLYAGYFRDRPPSEGSGLRDRIRLGFVVTHRHEGIFLRCMSGILNELNSERFEVVVFCAAAELKRLQSSLASREIAFVTIPPLIEDAARIIREKRCDILYHWEAGSDSLNYFLPFFKLAPVQCTSHGSQITSGNPQIDYFYSSALMELETAQNHYAEKLWNSSTLLMNQTRLNAPTAKSRAALGCPEDKTLYMCLQNPLKLHPDFNRLIARVLREDPAGVVVVLRGGQPHTETLIRSHFSRFYPDVVDRLVILPHQPFADYLALIQAADVLLDPLYFGWGSSSYDSFSFNQPLVTLATDLNVGRVAKAFYSQLEMHDLVATSKDEYVQIAVKLGRDVEFRKSIRDTIANRSERLFGDRTAVRDHERFFEMLYSR